MKNPIGGVTKEWFGGLSIMDMGAALGGLAASTMLPGLVIKDTSTTTKKLMKVALAVLSAVGAGMALRNVSPNAGKYAVAGGMAGALAQTLTAFTGVTIGQNSSISTTTVRREIGRIAESRYEPSANEAGVQVSVT